MKISDSEVSRILRSGGGATSGAQDLAVVQEIRNRPNDVEVVAHLVEEAPEVRVEMVEEIKSRTADGTYSVTGEEIADLIVRRAVADSVR